LAWAIEFEPTALKELKKLGGEPARQIVRTLEERIASLDDPRSLGAPLTGPWRGYWRWRMGDYRVVARIEDERVLILIVRVAHRREVYR